MCSLFVTSNTAKGMVAKGIMCGVSAGALYASGKDWKPQFPSGGNEECEGWYPIVGVGL
jgi:hypothetical protein